MKRFLLYPYDQKSDVILKYKDKISDIEITSLVAPRGWGLNNEIVGESNEYIVTSNFNESIKYCEGVWFVNSEKKASFKKLILPKVLTAVNENKEIFFTRHINDDAKEILYNVVPDKLLTKVHNEKIEDYLHNEEIYMINVPIICVIGVTEHTNKCIITLDIKHEMEKYELNILPIVADEGAYIKSSKAIPEFVFKQEIAERNKILAFNHYIKKLEKEENPDVIIIEIPGEAMPFSRKIVKNFGTLSFDILNAIAPDITILSTAYENFSFESLMNFVKKMGHRLDINIDYCNIVPRMIEMQLSDLNKHLEFIELEPQKIFAKVKDMESPKVYSLNYESEVFRIVKNILSVLEGERYEV